MTGFSLEKVQENGGIIKTINLGHDARCRATMLNVGPQFSMKHNAGSRRSMKNNYDPNARRQFRDATLDEK